MRLSVRNHKMNEETFNLYEREKSGPICFDSETNIITNFATDNQSQGRYSKPRHLNQEAGILQGS